MHKIRHGIFETNSSSSHSIVIAAGACKDTLGVDPDGIVRIQGRDFGWEIDEYRDAMTKASYCLTYVKSNKLTEQEAMLREVILEHTGAKDVEFIAPCPGAEWAEWGSIDHQSSDVCRDAFGSELTLRQFLFCGDSILRTDNDNH